MERVLRARFGAFPKGRNARGARVPPVACQAGVECDLRARFLAFRPAEARPEVTLHLLPSRFTKQPDRQGRKGGSFDRTKAAFGTPNVAFGTPNAAFGTPNAAFGTPNAAFGTPNAAFGTPNAAFGTPNAAFGIPNVAFGTPNVAFGTPNVAFGIPNVAFGTPNVAFGTPNVAFGIPNAAFGIPNATFDWANWVFCPDKLGVSSVIPVVWVVVLPDTNRIRGASGIGIAWRCPFQSEGADGARRSPFIAASGRLKVPASTHRRPPLSKTALALPRRESPQTAGGRAGPLAEPSAMPTFAGGSGTAGCSRRPRRQSRGR